MAKFVLAYKGGGSIGDSPEEQQKIMDRLAQRFKQKGGMTPALSEKIGYGGA